MQHSIAPAAVPTCADGALRLAAGGGGALVCLPRLPLCRKLQRALIELGLESQVSISQVLAGTEKRSSKENKER
jgi:hypothetical protein